MTRGNQDRQQPAPQMVPRAEQSRQLGGPQTMSRENQGRQGQAPQTMARGGQTRQQRAPQTAPQVAPRAPDNRQATTRQAVPRGSVYGPAGQRAVPPAGDRYQLPAYRPNNRGGYVLPPGGRGPRALAAATEAPARRFLAGVFSYSQRLRAWPLRRRGDEQRVWSITWQSRQNRSRTCANGRAWD